MNCHREEFFHWPFETLGLFLPDFSIITSAAEHPRRTLLQFTHPLSSG